MKKISLSMLLAFVVAAMFATVAFAAATDKPNLPTDVKITFTKGGEQVYANWTVGLPSGAPAVTSQTVVLYNVTDSTNQPVAVSAADRSADLTSLVTVGKTYQIGVKATNANGTTAEVLSNVTTIFTGSYTFNPENEVIRSTTTADNDLQNANGTGTTDATHTSYNKATKGKVTNGVWDVSSAASGQAVHGNYQNNTNSCASCHQTHTAATSRLLFKSSDYDVCIACHNGTMGAGMYNVFETDVTKDLGGGTFGGTHGGNMSVHLADGSVEIGAAPGSNSKVLGASWTAEFSCSSCHDPHGSYSTRLLKSNPNDMADVDRQVNTTKGYYYGQKINNLVIKDATTATTWSARKALLPSSGKATDGTNFAALLITIQPGEASTTAGEYFGTGLKDGDKVVQVYKYWENIATPAWGKAIIEQAGGNSGDSIDLVTNTDVDFNGTNFDTTTDGTWKKAISNAKAAVQPGYLVNGAKGFVRVKAIDVASLLLGKVTNVKTLQSVNWPQTDTALSFPNGKKVTKTLYQNLVNQNVATGYNEFCAACHVDYLTSKKYQDESTGTGIDENYFHHAMDKNYTCARCHFAHGTDVTWMRDAAGRTIADLALPVAQGGENMDAATATTYLMDQNPSSALKRYTNMAVCYGCHTSSHAEVIVNDGSYATSNQQVNGFLSDGYGKWFSDAVNGYSSTTKDATWGTTR